MAGQRQQDEKYRGGMLFISNEFLWAVEAMDPDEAERVIEQFGEETGKQVRDELKRRAQERSKRHAD